MPTQITFVPAEVQLIWDKVAKDLSNPLGLTEEIVQQSLEQCPPVEYEGAQHLGRYLIPRQFVRYDLKEQPRDKNNEADHVNNLVNNYEVYGYKSDCPPPICCFDGEDLNPTALKAQSGYNRFEALTRIGQDLYVFDVYKFDSLYWEIVARNQSNHHANPQLPQKITDYIKEVCNAVERGVIERTEQSIGDFVDLIASDRSFKSRKKIKVDCFNNCQVYPNFRTYNSVGHTENTLNGFIKNNNFAKQGVENRTDAELIAQGYISYCCGAGDNKSTWGRALAHASRLGIPVYVFGYAPNRVPDLQNFRENFINEFNEMKSLMIEFAAEICDVDASMVDEENFPIKLAGFLAQYIKPNPEDKGRPTEEGLVDMFGNKVVFNGTNACLTLTQP